MIIIEQETLCEQLKSFIKQMTFLQAYYRQSSLPYVIMTLKWLAISFFNIKYLHSRLDDT
jgi:hypothetical protein